MIDARNYHKLLRWLAIRPRATAETRTYLSRRLGISKQDPAIEKTIIYLTEQRFLDDEAFARWLVQSRLRRSPRGTRLLSAELYTKGIGQEIIESVLAGITPHDEMTLAQEMLDACKHRYKRLPALAAKRRCIEYLKRRGFSLATILRVIDTKCEKSVE